MLHNETEQPVIEAIIEIGDPDCKTCKERRDNFAQAYSKLKKGVYVVRINRLRKRRTDAQNRLYWLWMNLIAQRTGDLPMNLHLYFRSKFLAEVVKVNLTGEDIVDIKSTTKLSTTDFSQYMENIRALIFDTIEFWLPDADQELIIYEQ